VTPTASGPDPCVGLSSCSSPGPLRWRPVIPSPDGCVHAALAFPRRNVRRVAGVERQFGGCRRDAHCRINHMPSLGDLGVGHRFGQTASSLNGHECRGQRRPPVSSAADECDEPVDLLASPKVPRNEIHGSKAMEGGNAATGRWTGRHDAERETPRAGKHEPRDERLAGTDDEDEEGQPRSPAGCLG